MSLPPPLPLPLTGKDLSIHSHPPSPIYVTQNSLLTSNHRFTLHPTVSLSAVAQRLPFTYTGADFYALCSDAMLKAVTRQAAAVDAKVRALNESLKSGGGAGGHQQAEISTANFFDHHATADDVAVMVTEQDFLDAHRELVPSVSAGELEHYERVRATFEGGRDRDGRQSQQQQQQQQGPDGAGDGDDDDDGARISAAAKGKGKAVATAEDHGYDYDEDGAGSGGGDFVNNNNSGGGGGGSASGKGKGKAVARFQDGTASDDDGLY